MYLVEINLRNLWISNLRNLWIRNLRNLWMGKANA